MTLSFVDGNLVNRYLYTPFFADEIKWMWCHVRFKCCLPLSLPLSGSLSSSLSLSLPPRQMNMYQKFDQFNGIFKVICLWFNQNRELLCFFPCPSLLCRILQFSFGFSLFACLSRIFLHAQQISLNIYKSHRLMQYKQHLVISGAIVKRSILILTQFFMTFFFFNDSLLLLLPFHRHLLFPIFIDGTRVNVSAICDGIQFNRRQ